MRAQAGTVGRRIRLYGVALVKQAFVIHVPKQVPQGFDITVVVGNVRIVHIDPITDAFRHRYPFGGVFHDLLAAGLVVFGDRDLGSDVRLGDAEFLLDSQLDRQAMGIPTGATGHLVPGLGLVAADGVLDGAGHDVVDAGHAVRGRRSLEEYEFRGTLPDFERLLESMQLLPTVQHIRTDLHQIQSLVLLEHYSYFLCIFASGRTAYGRHRLIVQRYNFHPNISKRCIYLTSSC